jgi:hypothetical protein
MENFDEYLIQGEPNKVEKAKNWKTAIGLQQLDGLIPSEYLIETARQNIEGDITIEEVKNALTIIINNSQLQKTVRKKPTKFQHEWLNC